MVLFVAHFICLWSARCHIPSHPPSIECAPKRFSARTLYWRWLLLLALLLLAAAFAFVRYSAVSHSASIFIVPREAHTFCPRNIVCNNKRRVLPPYTLLYYIYTCCKPMFSTLFHFMPNEQPQPIAVLYSPNIKHIQGTYTYYIVESM